MGVGSLLSAVVVSFGFGAMARDALVEEMERQGQYVHPDDFEKSLFEVLWERAKELERADDIQRTITLDAQYRMPKCLGDFISHNFYEKIALNEKFESPLGNGERFHQPLYPQAYHWLDVRRDKE